MTAGLEVVVRPVVFPNIRPQSPRVLVSSNSDNVAVIQGSNGKLIDLPHTWSLDINVQEPQKEAVRQFDKQTIYQTDQRGNINRQNFIEVETLKRIRLDSANGPVKINYADPPQAPNIETTQTDVTR